MKMGVGEEEVLSQGDPAPQGELQVAPVPLEEAGELVEVVVPSLEVRPLEA